MWRNFISSTATMAVALGFMAAASPSAMAQEKSKLDEVLERGHLVVGTGSTNAPWHFKDATDNLVGFDVDMARLVAKGLFDDPDKIEFVFQSGDARIPNLTTEKVDITCQFMTVTAGRAQQVEFTIPYYREGVGLLMLEGGKHKNFDELKAAGGDVTVSVLQNVYAEEMVHGALPEAKVDQYESVDLMYQALNSSRSDAAATDQSSLKWFMLQSPGRYRDAGFGWNPQSYSCAVKPGDQRWLNFVNSVFHEAMTGVEFGTYAASFKKWFGVELSPPQIGFPVEYN
ncbi:MAG: transporter substrate-binding domain-containing protein [Alphaproteobacteria bacterium]|nr:transporter substrate-binding domain-containing protein [Alphaproteobacteria bacterium]